MSKPRILLELNFMRLVSNEMSLNISSVTLFIFIEKRWEWYYVTFSQRFTDKYDYFINNKYKFIKSGNKLSYILN